MSRARSRPRKLFLHTSALSDAEYAVYVDALHDVLDDPEPELSGAGKGGRPSDEELEARMVGMREARAWMRGRYRDVGVNEIDKILHLFSAHVQKDCISGGQFLAALRLLMHARSGANVDEGLVFIQAEPSSPTTAHPPLSNSSHPSALGLQAFSFPDPQNSEPPTSDLPPPPVHPASSSTAASASAHTSSFTMSTQHPSTSNFNSFNTRPQARSNSNPFVLDPAPTPASFSSSKTSPSNDPASFNIRRASLSSAPAASATTAPPPVPPKPKVFPPTRAGDSGAQNSSAAAATPPVPVTPGSTNPFLQRAKTHSGAHGPGAGLGLGTVSGKGKTPPLPPRKPTSTYNAPSGGGGGGAQPSSASTLTPPIPTPTLTANLVSPLMKQSLEASKQGHALKRAQAEAERARVLEVIRSSNSAEHRGRSSGSRSPTKGLGSSAAHAHGHPHPHGLQHIGTTTTTTGQHRRPVPSPPRSAVSSVFSATSAGSFDQVASARLGGLGGVSSPSATHSSRRFGSPDRFSSSAASTSASSAGSSYRANAGAGPGGDAPGKIQRTTSGPEQLPVLDESGPGQIPHQHQHQHQQSPYSAPPTHPDRRLGGSTTPRHPHAQMAAAAAGHRRSPSYQSTTSAYSSRSHPSQPGSRNSPTEDADGGGDAFTPSRSNSNIVGGVRVRPVRSQSMHQQSSPTMLTASSSPFSPTTTTAGQGQGQGQGRVSPPLPPPRRKSRPESVQIGMGMGTHASRRFGDWGGAAGDADVDTDTLGGGDAPIGSPFANAFARDKDTTRDRDRDRDRGTTSSPPLSLSALQRSLSTLHARAQPVLDRARYKAEAGFSRRGFVQHAHAHGRADEGVDHLVAHGTGGTEGEGEGDGGSVDTDLDMDGARGGGGMDGGGVDVDSLDYSDDGTDEGGFGARGRPARPRNAYSFSADRGRERDNLKLPVEGEGWRPL